MTESFFDSWKNWTDFCPSNGLTPWIPNSNDLTPCFQQVFLQMPIYTCFATFSSYYFGLNERVCIRNQTQLRLIYTRIIIALILASLPLAKTFNEKTDDVYPVDVLLSCTQCITWIVHIGYLLSLRRFGNRSHRGPLLLNVFWTAIVVLDIVWLRTSLRDSYWPWSLTVVILDCIYIITFIPNGRSRYARGRITEENERNALLEHRYVYFNADFDETVLGHAQDEANYASKILFYWVEPLIAKGFAGNLNKIEDLFDLPDCLNISKISDRIQMAIHKAKSLVWALHRAYGKEFYFIGILRFIADVSSFGGPLLLGGLLREQTTENSGTDLKPYLYAGGLFMTTLISAFCGTHFNWRMAIVGMKMRVGVVSAIYRKALEARGLQNSRPEILNLMSTDTDRIVNSCISFHSFWSIPFQLFTTLYLLYTQIGSAFIAGVIFAIILIPINRWISIKIGKYSQKLMSAKDSRLSATSETIIGAKQIKLYAWEDIFIKKIQELRKTEVEYLAKRKYLDALCVYFWATTPVLMCLLTFGVSVLMGNPLTASTTYTSVALLNMLISPLNAFPWVLNGLIEAWVSIKRVQEILDLPNLDFSSYYNPIIHFSKSDLSKKSILQIQNATFEHENLAKQESDFSFRLENVNLDIKKGELVCIEGPVGGGKSTLISAIVAEINCTDGCVCVQDLNEGFGYVTQNPWLQRGTIRENIIWGSVFDEQKYCTVINACALNDDFEILGGDLIGVGEGGRTLSGGQRVRVALARAVYQEKKIYLMDNILSCLDAHVANHIIKNCILGILKDKTRIIVTENRTLFYNANQIFHVENGTIVPSNFMSESFELSDGDDDDDDDVAKSKVIEGKETSTSPIDLEVNFDDKRSLDSVMMEESKEHGNLSMNVISTYWNAVSCPLGFTVLSCVVLMQVSRNLSDAWLAHWVTDTNVIPSNHSNNTNLTFFDKDSKESNITTDTGWYLGIYSSLALANSVITLARAFLFAYAGLKAAKFVHDKLLHRVIYTKFYFFDITSAGRILNRFSSDTYAIDDSLPFTLNILLAQTVGLIGAISISLYAMPWLSLVIIPMVPIYISIQHRYRHASRDIKRISSNALSPIYTHFTETLQGLTTIKAMRASHRFNRDFHVKLEESIKAQLTMAAAQQWLSLRLQMLGTLLVGGAGLLAAITSAHATNPGLVGLSVSYALSVTGLLAGVLNALAETEQEMIAVERVNQYLQLEPEENAEGSADPPFAWPSQGVVCFKDVTMRYREHLAPALNNFDLSTTAFERIAIIGRTGAGKSSVLSALLRVAPLSIGEITVDCVNVKTLALRVLRDRVIIIPQEPFLFEGTVRDNLDPRKNHIDSEVWNAITNCLATPLVQSLGGLNGHLEIGGKNLSAGQRQLLCLTRALLKNSKIVCIDEGTSNLDKDSEAAIQLVLRNAFKSSTVLYIAHHLEGLNKMDRIIVMNNGQIIEQGNPKELAENSNSIFHSMLNEQKNKDYIMAITPSASSSF